PRGPEAAESLQAGPFLVGQVGRLVANPRKEHVQVHADEVPGDDEAELAGDRGAPVAALRAVARVAEAPHQLIPGAGDAVYVPSGVPRGPGEPKAGDRR